MQPNPDLKAERAKGIQMDNELSSRREKLNKVAQEVSDVRDMMRKYREKQVELPGSAYCKIPGGFLVKLHSKQIYPFLESRLQFLEREKKLAGALVRETIERVVASLKKKESSWSELEKDNQKAVQDYMDTLVDED